MSFFDILIWIKLALKKKKKKMIYIHGYQNHTKPYFFLFLNKELLPRIIFLSFSLSFNSNKTIRFMHQREKLYWILRSATP